MRVLQLLASTGYYGAEGVVSQLSRSLVELGCDVIIALFNASQMADHGLITRARNLGIDLLDIPCSGRLDFAAISTVKSILQQRKIDLLHTHSYKANFYGLLAARLSGVPVVATCHNWTNRTRSLRAYGSLDKRLLRFFDHVVTVSESTSKTLIEEGFDAARVTMIGNGIDTNQNAHSRWNFEETGDGAATLGTVSRLSREKGVDVLVRAVAELRRQGLNVRCRIAGDGPERSSLLALATELGVGAHIALEGFCSDVPLFLAGCDIVVHPSRIEAMPLAVLEAMAAGKPIVATTVGSIPTLIQDGHSGILVPPDDPHALSHGILRMLNDGALRRSAGFAARRYVIQHCDVRLMAQKYLQLYCQVAHPVLAADVAAD